MILLHCIKSLNTMHIIAYQWKFNATKKSEDPLIKFSLAIPILLHGIEVDFNKMGHV